MHAFISRTYKNIIGIKLSGILTHEEYLDIVPYLENKIREHGKIRLFVELDHWEGWGTYAAFNDALFVFKHGFQLERVAFIVKSKEDRQAILFGQPFSPWFRNTTRYFSAKERNGAWSWLGENIKGFKIPEETETVNIDQQLNIRYGPKMRVLVIGGGVSSYIIATTLLKRGFKPTLAISNGNHMQKESNLTLNLWPTAGSALKALGLYKKVLKAATSLTSIKCYNAKGEPVVSRDYSNLFDTSNLPIAISESDFFAVLSNSLKKDATFETEAITKIQETSKSVKVTFSDGTFRRFDAAICADGLFSKTRARFVGHTDPNFSGLVRWSFTVPSTAAKIIEASTYYSKDGFIRMIPHINKLYCSAVHTSSKPKDGDKQINLLKKHFGNFPDPIRQIISAVDPNDDIQFKGLYFLENKKITHGRLILFGSAAFSFLGTTFLNHSIAIQAAYSLAEYLCRSDSRHVPIALASFEKYFVSHLKEIREKLKDTKLSMYSDPNSLSAVSDFQKEIPSKENYRKFWSWFNSHSMK